MTTQKLKTKISGNAESLEGVLLRISAGIGRNIVEAEQGLKEAKKHKHEGLYYNIVLYEGESLKENADPPQAVENYLRLEQKLSNLNDKQSLQNLESLKYDEKTGLLNRVGYNIEIEKLKRKGDYLPDERYVILLDGDDMHYLNQQFTYDTVDEYLKVIGAALKKQTDFETDSEKRARNVDVLVNRKNDSAGDEFIINIRCSAESIASVAQRYVKAMYAAEQCLTAKIMPNFKTKK
jgi:GGDEF domain-containing protein